MALVQHLWAYRPRGSGGFHWTHERKVNQETAAHWLAIFAQAEPMIKFKISSRKPKLAIDA